MNVDTRHMDGKQGTPGKETVGGRVVARKRTHHRGMATVDERWGKDASGKRVKRQRPTPSGQGAVRSPQNTVLNAPEMEQIQQQKNNNVNEQREEEHRECVGSRQAA